MRAPGAAAVTALWIVVYCASGQVAGLLPTIRLPPAGGGSTSDVSVGPTAARSTALKPRADQSTLNSYRSRDGVRRGTAAEVTTGALSIGQIALAGAEAG